MRRPKYATSILVAGAITYWFLCQPAIWTRGYPRVDPFWQAMPWLWFVPVVVSAVYDDDRHRRFRTLILFSLFAGLTMSGTCDASLVPRGMSFAKMLIGTVFWGPINLGANLLIERGWQKILWRIRRFTDEDKCGGCGYIIRYLTVARCPECGTPFDARWLMEDEAPLEPTDRPWRTRAVVCVMLASTVLLPLVFHVATIEYSSQRGWASGKRDWQAGNAMLYVDYSWIPELTDATRPVDPLSGLALRPAHGGLERMTWHDAYNAAVNDELANAGRVSLSAYVFSNEGLEKLFNFAIFRDIPDVPFQIGEHLQLAEGPDGLTVNGISTYLDSQTLPRQFALLEEPDGLVVLRGGNEFWTVLEDGTLLQYAMVSISGGHLKVLP